VGQQGREARLIDVFALTTNIIAEAPVELTRQSKADWLAPKESS